MSLYKYVEDIKEINMYSSEDIKRIRLKIGATQAFLAEWLGVSKRTVEAWECGRNMPNGPSARLLALLDDGKIEIKEFTK